MNSRERVLTALDHHEPDRVPFDLGGTVVTGIHVLAYTALRRYLGLPEKPPRIVDMFQQIVQVDDDLSARLGIDIKNIAPRSSGTYQIKTFDLGEYTAFYDEFGIGWRMPNAGGLYYDMYYHPLAGEITLEQVRQFHLPDPLDPTRFVGLAEAARRVAEVEQRAVVVGSMSAGVLEMTAWTRGFNDYFADLGSNEKLAETMMDRVLEQKLAYWGRVLELTGGFVDVAQEADDFAGQFGMLISPQTYRKLVKPRHKILFEFIHARSRAKVFFHSCGAVRPIIPDLIEIGVDILNPVQVSASGMDSAGLKRDFGHDLVFWGGGVDTQVVLCKGTPAEIRTEVRRRLDDLMPGGGFIFTAVHNIQADVAPEKIMAMWEALQEFGAYHS
jgi:uroporphyrinogen decarboxylase